MKHKVLVFPCGSEIGLEIHKALKFCKDIELFGASSVSSNNGKYQYKNYIEGLPWVEAPGFIDQLNELILKHNIDFIYPAHDSVLLFLSQNQSLVKATVIASEAKTCEICRSKALTYQIFNNIIPVPKVYNSSADINEYPVFLKPDVGQGAKGVYLAKNKEEVDFYRAKDNTLLMLEYLPYKEYTVDCFTDSKGNLLFAKGRLRSRIQNGISVDTFPVDNPEFLEFAEKINKELKFKGAWFFQLKENKNKELMLLEIAPRIAGTMALFRNLGVNFPLLSIYTFVDMPVEIMTNEYHLQLDRALSNSYKIDIEYDHVYVDLDDTIINNDKIVVSVVSFLFQCLNNGKKIYLITRHKEIVENTLNKFRIQNMFDEIIHITNGDCKSLFIDKGRKAIFIDDSFAERKKVKTNCSIPVFDISQLESLIENHL
ncbi:ATP-grasp domain-containing protein [Chitinophaga silvatica]|uniref:ATP-grasp domain-containing protein n=1 Tax=Chitinophaga silvatica TaxID=2282649 RepID=A0A3E1YC87_9BACT|nr:ATP-grasp domain-containing protein [Chitinophaga silvatica]RFS23947.1 ATP-grasp domain-containing protein [Chitinophaga silvatica]